MWGGVRDLGGRGLVLFAGGVLVGTWVGELGGGGFGEGLETWVEGGLLREKSVHILFIFCSYLFIYVQVCSGLFIFVHILFKFCSDFVQICSYLFIFVHIFHIWLWPCDLKLCSDFAHIC